MKAKRDQNKNELPPPVNLLKNDKLNQPFLKEHMMKNNVHDTDRERAVSLSKNLCFVRDIALNNPYFNRKEVVTKNNAYMEKDLKEM